MKKDPHAFSGALKWRTLLALIAYKLGFIAYKLGFVAYELRDQNPLPTSGGTSTSYDPNPNS